MSEIDDICAAQANEIQRLRTALSSSQSALSLAVKAMERAIDQCGDPHCESYRESGTNICPSCAGLRAAIKASGEGAKIESMPKMFKDWFEGLKLTYAAFLAQREDKIRAENDVRCVCVKCAERGPVVPTALSPRTEPATEQPGGSE